MASKDSKAGMGRTSQRSTLLKVVLLGDGGVGKSCLMARFVNNQFDPDSFHTIGVEFLNRDIVVNGEVYTLQIWDTAGQERFRSLRTPFYRGSDICILTYSIDEKSSFENLTMWKKEFLYYADVKEPTAFPFLVVGNKLDVSPEKREVPTEDGKQWALQNNNIPFAETSAKDATNVEDAFMLAVDNWIKMEAKLERPYVGDTVDLKNHSPKSICCG